MLDSQTGAENGGREKNAGAQLAFPFPPFSQSRTPNPWDGAAHIQGRSFSVKLFGKSHTEMSRGIFLWVILGLIKLALNISHHSS